MTALRIFFLTGTLLASGYLDIFCDKERLDRATARVLGWVI